ncbi:ketopantoate reductase family protein [Clostridium tepidum]|jgi:2-dehydropantoate 2-reductase|uniref:2-dehydropantoate 2-reductase n=1 Tax=Clostridium tepidum TaxID=1962263 RepID=A0A1S9IBG0_9CLOT|nr:2-dehydropantoate 2-reductase [Clostridium tepidum]MCR1933429.1 2-dehydropantoate 2-reductase [Clostridium tepidum]MDU6878174.1 2-dehydropantoate 2-reductase [Clostridium botulinum]OOO61698.1 2-dehydropantoate 2-reductase [Clostridium tepidum]OOO67660.1 2-dehydropantoate 2-reductase [Clostridium tepidum]
MKIAIIGAGAMGSLYGAYLHNSGEEVYLINRWEEHINVINTEGLIIEEREKKLKFYPKAVTNSRDIGIVDLAIIFVKSTKTEEAILENKNIIGKNTYVLSLQNGYGNGEKIEKYINKDRIIVGTTGEGCTTIKAGYIKHAGSGDTYIGMFSGKEDSILENLENILNYSGFNVHICKDPSQLIWNKLIINVGINAITAILKIKNGELLKQNTAKSIMKNAVIEAVKVANAKGFNFDEEEMIDKVEKVALKTAENKSSMLQDISNNKKTEIEVINGAIVREGIKLNIKTPVNETLTNLIIALENK